MKLLLPALVLAALSGPASAGEADRADLARSFLEFEAAYRAEPKASPLVNIALSHKALFEYPQAIAALDRAINQHADTLAPQHLDAARREGCLAFALSGLSKVCGLPQVKLAWIAVAGPDSLVTEALARLELTADAYLSPSTAAQLAAHAPVAGSARSQAETRAVRSALTRAL